MFTSPYFQPVRITGRNLSLNELDNCGSFCFIQENKKHLPSGFQTYWGIPFDCGYKMIFVKDGTLELGLSPVTAKHLVFLHACDITSQTPEEDGLIKNMRGNPPMIDLVCEYVIKYADGSSVNIPIRSRMEIWNNRRLCQRTSAAVWPSSESGAGVAG